MTLNNLTLDQAQSGLRAKSFSSRELVEFYLTKIAALNPTLNAYLALNNKARVEAEKADVSLPLGGIPIAVKDNFLTPGIETTASSNVLKGYLPHYESTVIKRLRDAGAIILGKTNMDAWAHGSSTETSDFGPTKNPWNVGHLPGGSSGGSAAAIAADLCTAAIGSETAGSIRQPAAWCGITGLKPTYGRVSRYGVVAMASSTDSPGPMTKTVADSHKLLTIIAGQDAHDATSSHDSSIEFDPQQGSLKGLRVGLPKEYLLSEMDSQVIALIHDAVRILESKGAEIKEISLLNPKYAVGVYTIIQRSEVSSNLARFDGIRYGHDRSEFGDEAKRRIMLGTYALSAGYADKYYHHAQKVRTLIINDYARAFSEVDVIVGPTSPGPALKLGASLDQPMFGEMEDILVEASSIAGLPGISVPCGFVSGLPIGFQINAAQWNENLVLKAAQAYQLSTNWHNEKPQI